MNLKTNDRKGLWILGVVLMAMELTASNTYSITYPNAARTGPATLPSFVGFDSYDLSFENMDTDPQAPAISEWTRSNGPGDTLALSASGMPVDYAIYAPDYFGTFSTSNWFGEHGAVTLPRDLPADTMYLLWPIANSVAGIQ